MNRSTPPPTSAADSAAHDPLDAVLRAWPETASTPGATESALTAILSRLDAPLPAGSLEDEQLLVAPMAEERDESAPSQPPVSLEGKSSRQRRTFQDIAKLAGPPSSRAASAAVDEWKEDSGVVDLKAPSEPEVTKPVLMAPISVAPAAAASSAPASSAPAAVVPVSAASSAPASVAPVATPAAAVAAPVAATAVKAPEEKKGGGLVVVLGLLGAAAIAAGVFVVAKKPTEEKKPEVVATTATAAPTAETPAKPDEKPTTATPISPEALATTTDDKAKTPTTTGGTTPATPAGGGAVAAATAKPEEKKPDVPVGEPGSLAAQMAQAAGPIDTSKTTGAQTGPVGNVPQRPSQGAVTGAMGKVLSAARACVTDDGASKATVTFGSSGAATGVSVSGPAAGTGAEGCIKSALMRANVGAFAESTYATTVTIRH